MQAVRWVTGVNLDIAVDAGIVIAGVTLTAVAAWDPSGLVGVGVTAPAWLLLVLPVLLGAPLALRRRAPLVMWVAIWVVIVAQYLITGHTPQGLELVVPLAAGYALGAHTSLPRSATGLVISIALILAIRPGLSVIPLLVCALVGVFVRARRRATFLDGQNAALQRKAEQAAADERAGIARELHDIIAHHLSVIVLQAAGARAAGQGGEAALAKIETSGRQALAETRRMLGVLRDPLEHSGIAPQPGIGELEPLVTGIRDAGRPVSLAVTGDSAAVPAALGVSVYRIVQEALTNVLKHAGPASAAVTIDCAADAVSIEISDDGHGGDGQRRDGPATGGHGLPGMRERVAIFGGELSAGPRPGGGFTVRAWLPLGDGLHRGAVVRQDAVSPGGAVVGRHDVAVSPGGELS
jgi:signal transduction histidine kinase